MRELTQRELNRATLARQLLLRRRRLPVVRAIERVGGLQAQWPPSPYVALWSRLEGFERAQLTRALDRGRVVKATLMRITLHLVSTNDYVLLAGALKRPWIEQLERRMERMGVRVDVPELARRAVALTAESPRSRSEVLEAVGSSREQPWFVWTLVKAHGDLVLAPESAGWRRTTGRAPYVSAQTWLGRKADTGPHALVHLVRRYLAAFGPSSRADVVQWSGLTVAALEPALDALEPLRRFRDERGRELLDLPRAALPPASTRAPVRLLPWWDSLLLAHADRTRVIDDDARAVVIKRNGEVLPTILVDGQVAGTWSESDGRVVLEPFSPLPRAARRELDDEAAALERFLQ